MEVRPSIIMFHLVKVNCHSQRKDNGQWHPTVVPMPSEVFNVLAMMPIKETKREVEAVPKVAAVMAMVVSIAGRPNPSTITIIIITKPPSPLKLVSITTTLTQMPTPDHHNPHPHPTTTIMESSPVQTDQPPRMDPTNVT